MTEILHPLTDSLFTASPLLKIFTLLVILNLKIKNLTIIITEHHLSTESKELFQSTSRVETSEFGL